MGDRDAFLRTLEANPHDDDTRLIFCDWLEERGEDDLAAHHRQWIVSRDWLRALAPTLGLQNSTYDYNDKKAIGDPITYEDLIDAGFGYLDDGNFWTQIGSEQAREMMRGDMLKQFWQHWSNVTGREYETREEDKPWAGGEPMSPFSCSC